MATVKVQDLSKHMWAVRHKAQRSGKYRSRVFSIQIPECSHLYTPEGHEHSMHWREIYDGGEGFGCPDRFFRTELPVPHGESFALHVRTRSRGNMYYLTVYVPADTEVRVRSVAY